MTTVRTAPAASRRFVFFPSMGEFAAYDDAVYDALAAPDARYRAYAGAVRAAAPDRVVLDIGTGRDALWAIEAAAAGARHVYAIEMDAGAAAHARRAITAAGLADRITLLAGHSAEQTLPVRAQVCVSEIVGNIASAEGAVAVLNDARDRLCVPDCVWIPFRAQTWAAAADLSAHGDPVLAAESRPYAERIFAAAGGPYDLRLCLSGPAHETLVSAPALLESDVFDSRRAAPAADLTSAVTLTVTAPGRVTGLLLWPRVAVTAAGREIDALTGDTRGWAPVWVPLPPATVTPGEVLEVGFTRRAGADGRHPDYELTTGGAVWRSPHGGGPFRASPFYRALFPPGPRC